MVAGVTAELRTRLPPLAARHGAQPPRYQSDQIAHRRCSHQRHGGRTLPGGGHANRREPPPHGRLCERQARQSGGVGRGVAHGYCGDRSDRQWGHQPLSETDCSRRPSKCEISTGHPAAADWIRGVTTASPCARRRLRLSSRAADHPLRARASPVVGSVPTLGSPHPETVPASTRRSAAVVLRL